MTTTSLDSDPLADWPQLEGNQTPLHLLVDDGDPAEAEKACTLAERIGKRQMPWQRDTLHGILALNPDALFTHPTAVVIACRQNGKTLSAAELRILYGAFVRRETIVYSAQRWLTAKSIYLRVKKAIGARPSLKARAGGWLCSQGVAGFTVTHADGAETQVMFITRSGDFRGPDEIDLVIYDEAYNLTDVEMSAISPTQLASKNGQTIYLSSAVNEEQHPNGQALARIRSRALAAIRSGGAAAGMFYAEYAAPEPDPDLSEHERRQIREDPATWRVANPSMGVIHSDAKVLKLLRELSTTSFEVEVLGWGRWPKADDDRLRIIPREDWNNMRNPAPQLVGARTMAIDRKGDGPWAIAAVQRLSDGRRHGEVSPTTKGTVAEIVEYVVRKVAEWNPAELVIDKRSDAMVLVPKLIEAGIEPTIATYGDMGQACRDWLRDALEGQFTHSDQRMFNDAVDSAAKRDIPGGGHGFEQAGEAPIAHVVAIALADWALLRVPPPKKKPAGPSRARASDSRSTGRPRESNVMDMAF